MRGKRRINHLALKGKVSRKRCLFAEVRSVRKFFNYGVYYHFLLALLTLTALKGGGADPIANNRIRSLPDSLY
jgi:hypothetical protein